MNERNNAFFKRAKITHSYWVYYYHDFHHQIPYRVPTQYQWVYSIIGNVETTENTALLMVHHAMYILGIDEKEIDISKAIMASGTHLANKKDLWSI